MYVCRWGCKWVVCVCVGGGVQVGCVCVVGVSVGCGVCVGGEVHVGCVWVEGCMWIVYGWVDGTGGEI